MPNKTLSLRDEDLALWERAERVAKDQKTSLSALALSALAEKLGGTETCRVAIYGEEDTKGHWEMFEGRWLTIAPDQKYDSLDWDISPRPMRNGNYADWSTFIAETARGRIAVYIRYYYSTYDKPITFTVFDDLDAARRALADDPRADQEAFKTASWKLGHTGKRGEKVLWRDV